VATTERALEAEVAVLADQDVEGYCRWLKTRFQGLDQLP
jgi:hypothetical protein